MNSADLEQLRTCCPDSATSIHTQPLAVADDAFTADRYQALLRVMSKIRETLDLTQIFQMAVQEVRQLLNADRAAVFRFYANCGWNEGEFVSEAVLPGFVAVLNAKLQDHCFGEHCVCQYRQGQVQAVADIQTAGLQDCHVEWLSRLQIRANLVVPLLQGQELWGLLCVHHCTAAHTWLVEEIEFAQQIATPLAIALKQAELLSQTQRQTQELAVALGQLKKSQTQLVQTDKLSSLGQLVAGIAHEINNPVNFICGNLNHASHYAQQLSTLIRLYQQELAQPSLQLQQQLEELDVDFIMQDFPKLLDSMQMGSDRIRQLVLSLRSFSRADAAQMQPANLHEGIDSTLLILQHRLKPKSDLRGIQIVREYGEIALVECYANQINQVFMNLLGNAIDALEEAMPSQKSAESNHRPQLTIRTMQIPDPQGGNPRVVICIADNGLGIPAEIQERLFEPFFTTKPASKGTGLGLSISRDIINRHGGELQCYSQLGQGTEFWIELPSKQVTDEEDANSVEARHSSLCPETISL